ncbi:MAG TPA: hypothetical protein VFU43_29520 [Streptosporangiaceae bacterium]|nr:hypothetical protein [Streptosporangiaceae bacterium]
MNLDKAVKGVLDAEAELAKRLVAVGERHAAEHDVYYLGHTLARQAADHVTRLTPFAERYQVGAAPRGVGEPPGILETVRHKGSQLIGRSEISGVLLLRDLRETYLLAQQAEIAWVILQQAALAVRDSDLLDVVTACHEQTETCAKWLRTRIKETAPQVLAAG